jgi:hypothetical protein
MITRSEFLTIHVDRLLVRERLDRFTAFLNGSMLPDILAPSMRELAQIALDCWNNRLCDSRLETHFFHLGPTIGAELDLVILPEPAYADIFKDKSASTVLSEVWERLFKVALQIDYDRFYVSQANEWMQAWLEEQWAAAIIKVSTGLDCMEVLTIFENTELLHNFYTYFIRLFPDEWLINDRPNWTQTEEMPEKMVAYLQNDSAFEKYLRQDSGSNEPMEWATLKKVQLISQQLTFSDEFSHKGYVLQYKNVEIWIEYWDNLSHPLLQAADLHTITTAEKIKDILSALASTKIKLKTSPSELAVLLLERFFQLLRNSWQILNQYEQNYPESTTGIVSERNELIQRGRLALQSWEAAKPALGAEIVSLIKAVASPIYVAEWIFDQRPNSGGHPAYVAHYNNELAFIRSVLEPLVASISITDQIEQLDKSFSFPRLKYITELLIGVPNEEKNKKQLLDTLRHHLKNEKHIWLGVFDQQAEESLNASAKVIGLFPDTINQYQSLFDDFCAYFEGWNVQTEDLYSAAARESFIYCATIPYFERQAKSTYPNEDVLFFKYVINKLIRQHRFSNYINHYIPVIARLAHTAEILGVKELYDQAVITKVDVLFDVLEILAGHPGSLSDANKALLRERVNKELLLEKLKLRGANPANTLKRMDVILESLQL